MDLRAHFLTLMRAVPRGAVVLFQIALVPVAFVVIVLCFLIPPFGRAVGVFD